MNDALIPGTPNGRTASSKPSALPAHYVTLGVSQDATSGNIKKAYRKLALSLHPDRTSKLPKDEREAAETRFKEVTAANEVLGDPKKRKAYDKDPTGNPTGEYDSFSDYQAQHPKWRQETSPLPNNLSEAEQLTYTLNTINNFFLYEVNLKKQLQDLKKQDAEAEKTRILLPMYSTLQTELVNLGSHAPLNTEHLTEFLKNTLEAINTAEQLYDNAKTLKKEHFPSISQLIDNFLEFCTLKFLFTIKGIKKPVFEKGVLHGLKDLSRTPEQRELHNIQTIKEKLHTLSLEQPEDSDESHNKTGKKQ